MDVFERDAPLSCLALELLPNALALLQVLAAAGACALWTPGGSTAHGGGSSRTCVLPLLVHSVPCPSHSCPPTLPPRCQPDLCPCPPLTTPYVFTNIRPPAGR